MAISLYQKHTAQKISHNSKEALFFRYTYTDGVSEALGGKPSLDCCSLTVQHVCKEGCTRSGNKCHDLSMKIDYKPTKNFSSQ